MTAMLLDLAKLIRLITDPRFETSQIRISPELNRPDRHDILMTQMIYSKEFEISQTRVTPVPNRPDPNPVPVPNNSFAQIYIITQTGLQVSKRQTHSFLD